MRLHEWIRSGRLKLGISQGALGDRMGVTQSAISKWELGKSEPSRLETARLEQVFGASAPAVNEVTFFTVSSVPVPVMGYVGRNQAAVVQADGSESIELPPGCPPDAKALIVRGNNLPPFKDGTAILYWTWSENPAAFLGELCVVETSDGAVYVREIARSSRQDRWNLISPVGAGALIVDVQIKRAALVEATYRRPQWITKT